MVHLSVYGFVLNLNDYFLLPIKQFSSMFCLGNDLNSSMSGLINVTSGIALVNLIGSGVYMASLPFGCSFILFLDTWQMFVMGGISKHAQSNGHSND